MRPPNKGVSRQGAKSLKKKSYTMISQIKICHIFGKKDIQKLSQNDDKI